MSHCIHFTGLFWCVSQNFTRGKEGDCLGKTEDALMQYESSLHDDFSESWPDFDK